MSEPNPERESGRPADRYGDAPDAPRATPSDDSGASRDEDAPDSGPRYTLREAADLTGRSVTTLRRYIRSGRLAARKTPGRFGPEYTLDEDALVAAGLEILVRAAPPARPAPPGARPAAEHPGGPLSGQPSGAPSPSDPRAFSRLPVALGGAADPAGLPAPLERVLQDFVPADLYRELSMKHEQLLVQYGMIRASGQRLYEFREEADRRAEDLRRLEDRHKDLQDRFGSETGVLKQHLRSAELEIEERDQEIDTLRQKIRTLELLTRNAVTNETIERQFMEVFEKERHIARMDDLMGDAAPDRDAETSAGPESPAAPSPDGALPGTDPAGPSGRGTADAPDGPATPADPDRAGDETGDPASRPVDRWLEGDRPAQAPPEDVDH